MKKHDPQPDEGNEGDEGETYEMADHPEDDATTPPLSRVDPRFSEHVLDDHAPDSPGSSTTAGEGGGGSKPKLLEGIPEPEFVDPHIQATRREEARIRSARDSANADAKRRRVKRIILSIFLIVIAAIVLWMWRF